MIDDHDRILALEEHVTAALNMICELTKQVGELADSLSYTNGRLKVHEADITAITVRLPRGPR